MKYADARGFSRAGAHYERSRPDYPADALEHLRSHLPLHDDSTVVDLGAGTGKLSAQIGRLSRRVVCIDSSAPMLEILRFKHPRLHPVVAKAERLPLRSSCADAVVSGQAFHWFDPVDALADARRVLRLGGGLALVWNVRDTSVAWEEAMEGVLQSYRTDAPLWHSVDWSRVIQERPGFSLPERKEFRWRRTLSMEKVLSSVLSRSYVAALPSEEQDCIQKAVTDRLDPYVSNEGVLERSFVTRVFCAHRTS